ncbi:SLATT domain-containing protein [Terribacillus goriensis]|uniref:SLATT domain-containing protein n=1 Tax=Terribacillus saccharophilus TaxID=361277 RepID=UPI0039835875
MNKNSLLKSIALKGYDVGFGAKKHFATYDLAAKAPNLIALGTLTAGVIQLAFKIPDDINKVLSVFLIFIGIVTIFINMFTDKKKEYEEAGIKINRIYQDLRNLYFSVQGTAETDTGELNSLEAEYNRLIGEFNNTGITHQMMFSDWYAHYKFFVQLETDWIEEQRPFEFRDKVPLALRWTLCAIGAVVAVAIVTVIVLFVQNTFF